MKHLNEEWRDLFEKLESEKRYLEDYIMTPKGAEEAVVWLAVMFAFCAIDGLWATWNLWNMWLSAL